MTPGTWIDTDIVLLGGGHSHVEVLKSFGMEPLPGVRLTLVARDCLTPYSGMLPGYLAGHYSIDEAHIDLRPLARFAGARLVHGAATGIDSLRRNVILDGRHPLPYDILSIDIGSTPQHSTIRNAKQFGLPVKPVDQFIRRLANIEARIGHSDGARNFVVIGGGAGGVELCLAIRYRMEMLLSNAGRDTGSVRFAIVTDTPDILPTHAAGVRRRMRRIFQERGISIHTSNAAMALESDNVLLADGTRIDCDVPILVTSAGPASWLSNTGLAVDRTGFLSVNESLQSVSDSNVFAAGDIASISDHDLPKAGVYAVRQGPVLAQNLRRVASGRRLTSYAPQRQALALLSAGPKYAVASYGPLSAEGEWAWTWKDWIDRRWMKKYRDLPDMSAKTTARPNASPEADEMRCGGCGAKVAADVLRDALDQISPVARDGVLIDFAQPDDAAVIAVPTGKVLVQSVDQFRDFINDPYLFGQITAQHCLNDIFAMGAEPHSAMALVTLPFAEENKLRNELSQLLTGAVDQLNKENCPLIGGHTAEGAELAFGLSVDGTCAPDSLLRKDGALIDDAIVLTKSIGTGTIFAADMRARASSQSVQSAIASMLKSNSSAVSILRASGVHALTDVTGFGLLGHLLEMLDAANVAAEIDLNQIPLIDGAAALLGKGIKSTMHSANERNARRLLKPRTDHFAYAALFDPQTSGGLLATISSEHADQCLADLRRSGFHSARIIGRITRRRDPAAVVELSYASEVGARCI